LFKWARQLFRKPGFWLALIIFIYGILVVPVIGRQGITFDEQTDMFIARSYISQSGGWLIGSPLDYTQTRLPVYITTIIFFLLNNPSLLLARFVAFLMGVLTLIGVYVFCKRQYDYKRGLVACFILATSPLFLTFSKIAFTESDIFVTCAITWFLICASILQEKRTIGWAAVTAIVLGLAISSKFTAIAVFPAIFLVFILSPDPKDKIGSENMYMSKKNIVIAGSFLFLIFLVIFGVRSALHFSGTIYTLGISAGYYFIAFLGWIAFLIWLGFHRREKMKPVALTFFVVIFSFLTFSIIPPVHITNPLVLKGLWDMFFGIPQKFNLLGICDHALRNAIKHFGYILIKSSLVIGAWLWLSLLIAIKRWKIDKKARLLLSVFVFYFLCIILLPERAQLFYTMPLLVILAIFASDQFLRLYTKKRFYAIVGGSIAVCLLTVDMFLCYPDYNLNGFQWVGRYFLGRYNIGCYNIVHVPFDGVEQVLKWANDNVQPEEKVVTYIRPQHIIRTVCQDPEFEMINGLENPKSILADADFVLIGINSEIKATYEDDNFMKSTHTYSYDREFLKKNFQKVFSVRRAFDLDVASAWRRKTIQNGIE